MISHICTRISTMINLFCNTPRKPLNCNIQIKHYLRGKIVQKGCNLSPESVSVAPV